MNYLFIDTETGGTDPQKHSLLSIGLVVWDEDKGIIGKVEYFIKHNKYVVTKKAEKINGFNIIEHNEKSLSPKAAIFNIRSFITEHFGSNSRPVVVGHNIQFDINFLRYFFKTYGYSFMSLISHRMIDTNSILKFLVISKCLPERVMNLSDSLNYFNIKVQNRHSALDDCVATALLFDRLIKLQKDKMNTCE